VAFALASAECPPPELISRADRVTVTLPWGSLLRGVLGLDGAVARGLVSLACPGAAIVVLAAPSDRDIAAIGVGLGLALDRTRMAAAWQAAGGELTSLRPATIEEILATGSTWAKRLGLTRIGSERSAWSMEARRVPTA
jgi:hypothetical protein